jgi:hypothetical protein
VKRFPDDFSQLLSARGKKILAGKEQRACGVLADSLFFTASDLLDPKAARAAPGILDRAFSKLMVEMARPAPPAKLSSMITGRESLPKTVRVLTSETNSPPTIRAATETGLLAMLRSDSYRQFVSALAGRPLSGPVGMQVLCYRPGDYAGPHTDNHPENPAVRNGYIDVHLTFCTPGVEHQYLVYEKDGHLSEAQSITATGGLTAYRLPFWHYTTPLKTRTPRARRWLVLGSFQFA